MVRSNELGCRNGWNVDLWVDGSSQRDQPHDSIGGKAKAEVKSAEPSDLITSIVAAKTDNVSIADQQQAPFSSATDCDRRGHIRQANPVHDMEYRSHLVPTGH